MTCAPEGASPNAEKIAVLTSSSAQRHSGCHCTPRMEALRGRHRHRFDLAVGRDGVGMQRGRELVDALGMQRIHLEDAGAHMSAKRQPGCTLTEWTGAYWVSSGASTSSR